MLRYAEMKTQDEKNLVFKLRYDVYCKEKGWEKPPESGSEIEEDKYDNRAVYFGAFDEDGVLIGAVRLVFSMDSEPLPFESAFNIELESSSKVAEISRLVISKDKRGLRVLNGLFNMICFWSIKNGLTDVYAVVESRLLALLLRRGYAFTKIGSGKDYFGEMKYPVHLSTAGICAEDVKVNNDDSYLY